ncbi:hypothetical protein A8C56_09190 [Niabella ginsenosidivorans]|uniref:Cyclic nucleotide-binding protein n=1 Tax=Niabella ginsenosidivorans TaxID=1176587 RepID=A0A1A9I0F8_9BACT|nr:DUF1003 domain-containing protein [Niabella ginsenosidivorans]ANH81128.1 hypothetical protein A8C56_09190 [Niabella ginsenosidivorans]
MNKILFNHSPHNGSGKDESVSCRSLRPALFEFIRSDRPDLKRSDTISYNELNEYKVRYISKYLLRDIHHLSELEDNVISSMTNQTVISDMIDEDEDTRKKATFGQRLADKVSAFGGSWTFIIAFILFLLAWIAVNYYWLRNRGFDPYPFILLNLILSCLAALQAPIIMMSQNRQEAKDRERSKMDYMVNLKSELEVRILHEKLDQVLANQEEYMRRFNDNNTPADAGNAG